MEKILESAATQVPALVVLVFVVVIFLRSGKDTAASFEKVLADQRTQFVDALTLRDERSGEVAEACHAVAREATEAVRENSRLIGRVDKNLESTQTVMLDTGRLLRENTDRRRSSD